MLAFSRAVTGLRIAEQNLYVTSNNLSNVETDGYHRQRLNQYSFQTTSRGDFAIGLGVDADTVSHARLEFLETNYRNELAAYGEYKYEDKVYTSLQSIIGDDGSYLQDTLEDMWESFNELAKEYTTTVAGSYLRENAVALVAEFDGINDQLDKMQSELDNELLNTINKINDYSDQIAKLNDKITRSEADGSLACELRDSRDSIIASLSELIDITVENPTNTCVNIRASNGYLVVRTHSNKIGAEKNVDGSTFNYPVWADTGNPLEVSEGELKGILDMRGGADVVGNMISSSNGNVKEKMDIVVSIDTDMDFEALSKMAKNFNDMLDMFDRQSVNYQLYLTNGKKVFAEDVSNFVNHLYSEAAKLQIDDAVNNGVTTVGDLIDYIDGLYGSDSQLFKDIWEYVGDNGADLEGFKTYIEANVTDDDMLLSMQELFESYKNSGGDSLQGFSEFLKGNNLPLEAGDLSAHLKAYVSNTVTFNSDDIKNYIDSVYNTGTVLPEMFTANTNNVLDNVAKAALIDFREDSNKYMMVFTDDTINNDVTIEDAASRMNEVDMNLIAVTTDAAMSSWKVLAEETEGNVFDVSSMSTLDGAKDLGLAITRDFNSRLIGADEESGVAYFRAGLNSLLNGLVREINGIMRQGANGYGNRHGDVVKDENGNTVYDLETGEPKLYNLDLFIKIDDSLPLQMGNIQINPAYDDVMNMPLSLTGATGDFQIGNMLVDLTAADVFNSKDSYSTIEEHYANFILDFGQAANRALTGYETQSTVLTTAQERISQVSGVSMDEELSNMVKYQYSYTAASKMIRVIDEMLETVINI